MNRRAFIGRTVATGLVLVSVAAVAQTSAAVRRIGVLEHGAPDTPDDLRKQAEPLRELGWVEGKPDRRTPLHEWTSRCAPVSSRRTRTRERRDHCDGRNT